MDSLKPEDILRKIGITSPSVLSYQQMDSIEGVQITVCKGDAITVDFVGSIRIPRMTEQDGRWVFKSQ